MPDPVDRQHERYNAAGAGMLSFSTTFKSNKTNVATTFIWSSYQKTKDDSTQTGGH